MENEAMAKLMRTKAEIDSETRGHLEAILEPYVWIDLENSTTVFRIDAPPLKPQQRVMIFAISKKVLSLSKSEAQQDFSPKDVVSGTGLPGGTVRPILLKFVKQKILFGSGHAYYLNPYLTIIEIEKVLTQ